MVVSDALGAPGLALLLPVAPIAPEPPLPEVFTPAKVTTVMEAATLCDKLAFTETLLRVVGAKARQISAVPNCALVRLTNDQVRLAPVTPVTVTPEEVASDATNASSNSLALDVEKVGEVMLVA